MKLSLSRNIDPDKLEWLFDLEDRFQSNRAWGYSPDIEPIEDRFMDDSRQRFANTVERLRKDNWHWLGRIDRLNQIQWLMQQDSWCIVDTPFGERKEALTRDELTSVKFKIKFGHFVNAGFIDKYIQQYHWHPVNVEWRESVPDMMAWCDTYCSDIYFFHTIDRIHEHGFGPTSQRQLIFANSADAIRFKLSGFGVTDVR